MTERNDTMLDRFLDWLGHRLATRLRCECSGYRPFTPSDFDTLRRVMRPGDVLLVEGNERISTAVKYLTQSTWSHAALYVGDVLPVPADGGERPRLIEVNLGEGCVAVPLSKYRTYNTRICRPVGLTDADRQRVASFMVDRIGLGYDMRNVFDLLRFFFPTPPVPVRWRRRLLAVGSGDPTRAICSSLIAQAFQSIRYPILPQLRVEGADGDHARREILHIRHHSLFVPRDFDLSPWFRVVKPTIEGGFDYRALTWDDSEDEADCAPSPSSSCCT